MQTLFSLYFMPKSKDIFFSIVFFRTINRSVVSEENGKDYTNRQMPNYGGAIVGVIVFQLDLQLCMQSVPITTNVASSNYAQVRCTRYNIM